MNDERPPLCYTGPTATGQQWRAAYLAHHRCHQHRTVPVLLLVLRSK